MVISFPHDVSTWPLWPLADGTPKLIRGSPSGIPAGEWHRDVEEMWRLSFQRIPVD